MSPKGTKIPTQVENGMMMMLTLQISISQLKFGLCPNSGLNSPLFSPFMNMHVPFAQNFPKFAIQEMLLWETFLVFYVLAPTNNKINNKSFLLLSLA